MALASLVHYCGCSMCSRNTTFVTVKDSAEAPSSYILTEATLDLTEFDLDGESHEKLPNSVLGT